MSEVLVRVPATTANLGPGFDCLALALDLWNELSIELTGRGLTIRVHGEGDNSLPHDESNLIWQAMRRVFTLTGCQAPEGVSLLCHNEIPLGSGLGSSAAAVLTGLLGANELCGSPLTREQVLALAVELEGHPDNAAAALYGGLVLVGHTGQRLITRPLGMPRVGGEPLRAAVVLPDVALPTHAARAALPASVPLPDAVFNNAMTSLVVQALLEGDLELLGEVMQDRLHQPYRLKLIPGAAAAIEAAIQSGAAAAALSGAGPSVIAFGLEDLQPAANAMAAAFKQAGVSARTFDLQVSEAGAIVERVEE